MTNQIVILNSFHSALSIRAAYHPAATTQWEADPSWRPFCLPLVVPISVWRTARAATSTKVGPSLWRWMVVFLCGRPWKDKSAWCSRSPAVQEHLECQQWIQKKSQGTAQWLKPSNIWATNNIFISPPVAEAWADYRDCQDLIYLKLLEPGCGGCVR